MTRSPLMAGLGEAPHTDDSAMLDWLVANLPNVAFTPIVVFSTPGNSSFVYTVQTGFYQLVGSRMNVELQVSFTPTIGTGSGPIFISGFPAFNAAAIFRGVVGGLSSVWTWPTGVTQVICAPNGTTQIALSGQGSGINSATFGASNMTTGQPHVIRAAFSAQL